MKLHFKTSCTYTVNVPANSEQINNTRQIFTLPSKSNNYRVTRLPLVSFVSVKFLHLFLCLFILPTNVSIHKRNAQVSYDSHLTNTVCNTIPCCAFSSPFSLQFISYPNLQDKTFAQSFKNSPTSGS